MFSDIKSRVIMALRSAGATPEQGPQIHAALRMRTPAANKTKLSGPGGQTYVSSQSPRIKSLHLTQTVLMVSAM